MEERKITEIEIRSILDHIEEILRYTDEFSDIANFTFHVDDGPNEEVHITAYFTDGGTKHIVTEKDMYGLIMDVLSGVGGPRVYNAMTKDMIAHTLSDLRDRLTDQIKYKEKAAINAAIQILLTGHTAPVNYSDWEDE